MLFSELYKIMVNKVTLVDFRGDNRPNSSPWIHPWPMGALVSYPGQTVTDKMLSQQNYQATITCLSVTSNIVWTDTCVQHYRRAQKYFLPKVKS